MNLFTTIRHNSCQKIKNLKYQVDLSNFKNDISIRNHTHKQLIKCILGEVISQKEAKPIRLKFLKLTKFMNTRESAKFLQAIK